LRHIHPNGWQRALWGEGALGVAVLLVLADLATAWTLLVLPLAVAAVVKAHDLLAGVLGSPPEDEPPA
jgi:quinol-cytochrome oxidoreductase complex cytochrome b subunit